MEGTKFGGYSDTETFDFVTHTPEIKKKSVLKLPDIQTQANLSHIVTKNDAN